MAQEEGSTTKENTTKDKQEEEHFLAPLAVDIQHKSINEVDKILYEKYPDYYEKYLKDGIECVIRHMHKNQLPIIFKMIAAAAGIEDPVNSLKLNIVALNPKSHPLFEDALKCKTDAIELRGFTVTGVFDVEDKDVPAAVKAAVQKQCVTDDRRDTKVIIRCVEKYVFEIEKDFWKVEHFGNDQFNQYTTFYEYFDLREKTNGGGTNDKTNGGTNDETKEEKHDIELDEQETAPKPPAAKRDTRKNVSNKPDV